MRSIDADARAALSGDAPTVKLRPYLATLPQTHSVAIFVGAMARGSDSFADGVVDEKIGISNYPLSASVACGKVRPVASVAAGAFVLTPRVLQFCCALEDLWDII
jgi:rRNA small subunit pseudouridine methyltransferase Nep1